MPVDYKVQPGDCISSIAYRHGFAPATIWLDEGNKRLRELRKNPNTLVENEDIVHVPDKVMREEEVATGKRHVFQRIGVPELLRLCFVDDLGQPRASIPFELKITGSASQSGQTGPDGSVKVPIQPDAMEGEIVLKPADGPEEHYPLALGRLHPAGDDDGVQQRLENLGFFDHNLDLGPELLLRVAIRQFQEMANLPVTGDADENTLAALRQHHGS